MHRRLLVSGVLLAWASGLGCAPQRSTATGTCEPLEGRLPVIIELSERVDPSAFRAWPGEPRGKALSAALTDEAERTQPPLRAFLRSHGAGEPRSLPILNAVAAEVPASLIDELRRFPGVARVRLDASWQAPSPAAATAVASPGWNLEAIGAPALWSLGRHGEGVVVASLDTGVDLAHADLQARWRGGADSWFDPIEQSTQPFDVIGHGTQALALAVGGDSSGAPLGVAPAAQWIAARIYDRSGNTSASVIHQAFQWLLDPDGDPATDDAPQVVNASWGSSSAGVCDPEFQPDLDALRAAGILVVFAAGNSGPASGSDVSPANNPGAFSTGAVDQTGRVAGSSSRGPSTCTGGLFPDLVAPGVNVRTADLSFNGTPQYTTVSGTSFAAPHVAGAAALLLQAHPSLTPEQLEDALRHTARRAADAGPDDAQGEGELDVAAAEAWLDTDGGTTTPGPIALGERSLPVATVGRPYEKALHADGGQPPLSWSISGALPGGITLGADGVLQGVPTRAGAFPFVLRIDDAAGAFVLQSFTLSVLSPPSQAICPPR